MCAAAGDSRELHRKAVKRPAGAGRRKRLVVDDDGDQDDDDDQAESVQTAAGGDSRFINLVNV